MQDVNWIDYSIIGLISISILMGIIRGFVREAMSLLTWIAAIFIAFVFCEPLGAQFTSISMPLIRYVLAGVLLVLGTLITGGIIGHLVAKLVKLSGFGIPDRVLGTFFGVARALALVAIGIYFIELLPVKNMPLWKESKLVFKFSPISVWLKNEIPEDFTKRIESLFSAKPQHLEVRENHTSHSSIVDPNP